MTLRQQQLPYFADSVVLFEKLADQPWAVMLDSGPASGRRGRYDILVADPMLTLTTRAEHTEIRRRDGRTEQSLQDPFELLREHMPLQPELSSELPFVGGWLGYLGYDLGRRIEAFPSLARDDEQLPEMAMGLYDWALVVDHQTGQSVLVSASRDPHTLARWDELVALLSEPAELAPRAGFGTRGQVNSSLDYAGYADAFERIQRYIRDGDCYQVNFTQRFEAACDGDPWEGYQRLRSMNPAPFAAYMNYPFAQILSASPERFISVRGGRVTTQPIKGTRPRSGEPGADWMLGQSLLNSVKDRAENVMIVDLLRNDISKSCRSGTVRVPKLFELQSFATVHHLVTTISGELDAQHDVFDLLRGSFPGGSITGAPKIRAMEIIEELEPCRRGVYCGAIGYIAVNGEMDTNIVIRTMTHHDGKVFFGAGGGITVGSTLDGEYQESFDKAAALLNLINSRHGDGDDAAAQDAALVYWH